MGNLRGLRSVWPTTAVMEMFVILLSSLSLQASYWNFKREKKEAYRGLLLLSFVLGVTFLVLQYKAWESLVGAAVDLPITPIGVVTDQSSLVIKVDQRPCLDLSVQQCRVAHAMALPRRIEADVEVAK